MKLNIGEFVKKRRKTIGMTQSELADAIGVDERTIRRIENNEYKNSNSTTFTRLLLKIADKLKLSNMEIKSLGVINGDLDLDHLDPSHLVLSNSINDLHHKLFEAQNFAQNSEYKDALEIYQAFENLSDEPFYKLGCATMHQFLGGYDSAISYCNKILKQAPETFEAHFIKATCLALINENELAVESFNQALEIKNDEKVHYNLGVLYMFTKSYQLAIDYYQTCLELNPNNASAHLNLGVCLFSAMSYEKSLIHFNKAKEIEPNLFQAYGQIGEYYRFFGEYEKAIENFEICLLLDSRNYQALYGIAFSLIKLNRVSEATIYYKLFINHYKKKLFKNKLTANIAIVDIGYETTTLFSIHLKPNEIASVKIDDFELQVNLQEGKSYIFIGAPLISDDTGSMPYAAIGKIYTVKKEFQQTVAKFKEKADLFQYFDQPLYVDFKNNISVYVIERNKNVLIEIYINDRPIIAGITDEKTGGLEAFIEHFNKNSQFRLHLETKGEVFIVDGLKNVNIKLLGSEK